MSLRHPTDRRDFLRSGSLSLAAMWMAACNSNGPKEAAKLLKYAEQKNESLEMWLVRHTAMDHGSPGATVANDMFPSYFVSSSVPV